MLKRVLSYGLPAGLMAGAPMSALVASRGGQPSFEGGMVLGYLTMLLGLSLVFVAIKRHRDQDLGGVIRFWPAFGLGLAISFVASLLYALAWEVALAVTGMDFAGDWARHVIEQKRAAGVSGAALDAVVAEMDEFRRQYASPLYRVPMTLLEILPVGLLVSLVSAGLLRNPRFLRAGRG